MGTGPLSVDQIPKLVYIDQVLKETLRLWPTAPAFALNSLEDTVIGGKYKIKTDDAITVLIPTLHRDTKVWGNNVEEFDPDRFTAENMAKLPPNAYKPFGNGARACIGRAFAIQESIIVLALILQRFDLIEADPSYQLVVKETLTFKPDQFMIRARKRGNTVTSSTVAPMIQREMVSSPQTKISTPITTTTPLLVLFGSNSGSSEAFASRIASDAKQYGKDQFYIRKNLNIIERETKKLKISFFFLF